jgi:alkylated DNA repair protein alkB family protein 1
MYKRNLKSLFPEDLLTLTKNISHRIGSPSTDLEPEAAIVNYYPLNASMGGHLDDAEHAMEKPIVSISLGCSAIFLIGGRDKTTKPMPILLRSGDALVMSGESRFCYHGVPVIVPPGFNPFKKESTRKYKKIDSSFTGSEAQILVNKLSVTDKLYQHIDPSDLNMKRVVDFLNIARININVRQVRIDTTNDAVWTDKVGTGSQKK